MIYLAEVLLLNSTDLDAELGEFETSSEAQAACERQEGDTLLWTQPWAEVWDAQGHERWYRVIRPR